MSQKSANLQDTVNAHRAELQQVQAQLYEIDQQRTTLDRQREERDKRRLELLGIITGLEHAQQQAEPQKPEGSE